MEAKLDALKSIFAEITNLTNASALLSWDQEVNMPPGGAEERGSQLATLDRLSHIKFTSDKVGQLLADLKDYAADLDPDEDDARLVKVAQRDYEKSVKVPADHVARQARLTAAAHQTWVAAKNQADFSIFQPHLEEIVALNHEYVSFFSPYDHVYDPLLDRFEPGMKTREVQAIFEALKPRQLALIEAITNQPQIDDAFLHQPFDKRKQWDFGVKVITDFGYDWDRGRQDLSPHPFTISFGQGDVRITTRVQEEFFNPAFFATLHECGHGLYNQGFSPSLAGTHLSEGASLAIHESQSRMWENLVGRSLPFWERYYSDLQALFPTELGNVSLDLFFRAVNKVEPSMIRVEADEATYNLHIMLRLALEIALMDGSLAVKDLPEAWNQGMQDFLGLTPANDAEGVLQDIHWSGGMLGYFSTYALGNLVSAQLWECIHLEIPNIYDQIRRGDFQALLAWGRDKIHRHGSKFEPQELVRKVTGHPIDPEPYVNYLTDKYTEIYQL